MDDLKLPVFLLILILCGAGYFAYTKFSMPAEQRVSPTVSTEKHQSDIEQSGKNDKSKEDKVVKKAADSFKKGDYAEVLSLLSSLNNAKRYDVQQMLAYSFSANKEFDRAIVAFEKVLAIKKVPIDGYSLAYLYEVTGRYAAAASLYQELANQQLPTNLQKSVYEGIARISAYYPENKTFYDLTERLVNRFPDSKDGIIRLIKAMKYRGDYGSLDKLLKLASKEFPKDYLVNYELAQLLDEAGKYDEAVKLYKICIKLDSKNLTPFLDCYNSLMKADRPAAAVRALEYYLASDHVNPDTCFEAALAAHKEKRVRQAFRLYLTAVTIDPRLQGKNDNGLLSEIEASYRNNGTEVEKVFVNSFVCYINGDYNYAMSEIDRIKSELENSVYKDDYKRVLAQCEKLAAFDDKRNKEMKAYEDYLKAMEKEKIEREKKAESSASAFGKSRGLSDNELKNKAKKAPKDYAVQFEVATEFLNRGNLKEAEVFMKNAAAIDKKSSVPFIELAKIKMMQRDRESAQKAIDEAISREPSNVSALTMAASIAVGGDKLAKAKGYIGSALNLAPSDTSVRIVRIRIHILEKEFAEAAQLINTALSEEGNNILRAELLQLRKQIPEKTGY